MTSRVVACAFALILLPRAVAQTPAERLPFCNPAYLTSCAAERMATPLSWPGGYVALDRALRTLARRAMIPMSMVVVRPVPNLELPRLIMTPAELLGLIVRTHPTYVWRISGGVLCFSDRRLQKDPQNFLNWKLASFTVGPDVGMDLLVLAQELHQPRRSTSAGMAIEGMRPMIAGAPKRAVLQDVSARAALHGLLAAAPTFFSEVSYRSGPPLTHAVAIDALEWWRWVPLDEPPIPPPPPPGPPIRVGTELGVRARAAAAIGIGLCAALASAQRGARARIVAGSGRAPGLDTPRHWPTARLSGRRLMWEISYRYRVPVSAVLALPINPTDIAAGEHTARAILDQFARANRNYSWGLSGAVVVVADRRIVNDANNFLNWRLPLVELIGPVGLFMPHLVDLIVAAPRVPHGEASSWMVPLTLNRELPRQDLRGKTAGDVLMWIMNFSGDFSSVVVFRKSKGLTRAGGMQALKNWRWVPLDQPPPPPPRVVHSTRVPGPS